MELDPCDANAQVALGIAALRVNDSDVAQGPLEKAVVLQPRNPFALPTLGQLQLMKGDAPAAVPHLRAAASVAPDDPINLFTYAQCLLAIEGESHEAEADEPMSSSSGPCGWRLWVSWPRRSRTSSAASPTG